ncbi:MAG: glycosyltransferase family 25 protein [Methylovulum sp.]|uniref:glycosyltransferase family 25 protein n=1 Tax=Methylovulum sp. TaxID=1916980 RepID=UPI002638ED56|nr:glycosyltransferase family 25 protein [Methylovulum sp.]MDD2725320.1 glycosyltransferase family 25 protein [Methylovulum sp.]MDD5126402.1 glycosyltransferase family 25 protein [Methylovulum sp.]
MPAAKQLDHIYVLNVKKFTQRREFMEQQLTNAGLAAEFIFDWDADELTAEIVKQYFNKNNDLTMPQKSCAMKHVAALQKIAASGSLFSLVLEDDAVFGKQFALGVKRSLEQSTLFPGEKVIYIGSGGNFFTPRSQRKPGQFLYPGKRGRFTDSYIIDSATAQKRLQWVDQHKMNGPIDNQFDLMDKQTGVQILWLEPPVIEQGSKNGLFNSAIETRWSSQRPCLHGLLFWFEKIKRKYIYQLWWR